ncbi:diaminobutyrate--2-oxoglutarate transaminase [Planctomycetota bacterium]|nr:diaminobutyrate--2-oxoglutarate transaminase [Planctomycetota bacterium]
MPLVLAAGDPSSSGMTPPVAASPSTDPRAAFLRRESAVRGYCRGFPAIFATAQGSRVRDETGREWIDFLCGAGSLNYGHNPPRVIAALTDYLASGGILHGLDLHTVAKRRFLEIFERVILAPRGMEHRVQFTNPTGTNAVEAAFKLARKITGRAGIHAFTNGYHGMTLGALAATGNKYNRAGAGVALGGATFLPFDGYFGANLDTIAMIRKLWEDPSSGVDLPAAVVVETVQGEGGINVASWAWLKSLAALCREHQVLLIVDDIQIGNGRSGTFFSYETAGIDPDLIVVSKSIGGCGLPLALVLIKPVHDRWKPAEHNGTFRGNQLAFVAAAAALEQHWSDRAGFEAAIAQRSQRLRGRLEAIAAAHPDRGFSVRGRGLMQGLVSADPERAARISAVAYDRGLIIERAGPHDEVVKAMPPLTIAFDDLDAGCSILAESVAAAG